MQKLENRNWKMETGAASKARLHLAKSNANGNELEKVTDPLTRLAPLASLSPKGARAGIQVEAPLAPLGERVPEVRGRVRGTGGL